MFWKKKEQRVPLAPKKSILEQLYSDRKMPKDIKLDMSSFSKEEQKEYKRYEFIRPYLNIHLGSHWTIQQKDSHWGTVETFDMPNKCLVFDIYHGEINVGELNFEIYVHSFDPHPNDFKGVISVNFNASHFDANEVRRFLNSLASIHHDYESKQYEQQKLKTNLEVSDIMTDNLWNAIQRNNNDDGYGFLNTMPELDLIEKGFEGNFDGYFLSVKHWKKNKVDPFELEERRINKTNDR